MMYLCGKYMQHKFPAWIVRLEAMANSRRASTVTPLAVRGERLRMSASTIDRDHRRALELKGISATWFWRAAAHLDHDPESCDETECESGFMECDTVAHCGPTLTGEFARTLTVTCVHTEWTHLGVLRHDARVHMLAELDRLEKALPFEIAGLDCDNRSEIVNNKVVE